MNPVNSAKLVNPKGTLSLVKGMLCWQTHGEHHSLSLEDIVGVSVVTSPMVSPLPCFMVSAYPLVAAFPKRWPVKRKRRTLQEYIFECPNNEMRSQWLNTIQQAIGSPPDGRHYIVLINTKSGKKKASKNFRTVFPLFEKSHCKLTLWETETVDDVQQLINDVDISNLNGFIAVGGDGTVRGLINGLLNRPDGESAIQIPISIIPAGTGNGLCKTLLSISEEPYDPLSAAFIAVKGRSRPIDIFKVQQENLSPCYGLLSLSWAIVSDVDIKSDRLRFLGSLKESIYALFHICMLKPYSGKLSFLIPEDLPQSNVAVPLVPGWHTIEDNFAVVWAVNVPWVAHDRKAAPLAQLADGAIDVLVVRRGVSRWQLVWLFLKSTTGEHLSHAKVEYYKVSRLRLEPERTQIGQAGLLAVDGDQVADSPIHLEVLSSLGRITCK